MTDETVLVDQINEGFKSIFQEMTLNRASISDTASQVQRIQRFMKLDEREWRDDKQRSEVRLLQAVSTLTDAVTALSGAKEYQQEYAVNSISAQCFRNEKVNRSRRASQHVDETKGLYKCRQELTPTCPCGEHRGLKFTDNTGQVVVDNMCPKVWWIKQSHVAFMSGRLTTFVNSMPISVYLKPYKLSS